MEPLKIYLEGTADRIRYCQSLESGSLVEHLRDIRFSPATLRSRSLEHLKFDKSPPAR